MNDKIKAPNVRVIGPDGKQCGIMNVADAIKMARRLHMDLVEIAANATPPVVWIVDVAKFQKERKRREPPPDYSNN